MIWLPPFFLGLILAVWLYWSISQAHAATFRRQLDPAEWRDGDAQVPGVALICPGRNEAEQLPRTLPTLVEQDHANLQVIFVDDASEDATPAITAELAARDPRLLVVRNEEHPPAGWVGKCWAVAKGYEALKAIDAARLSGQRQEARAYSWVCFTDADIDWEPACLRSAVRYAVEHDADMVALFPQLEFGSAGERLVQSAVFLGFFLLFPFDKAMDPAHPDVALTGGAFMLIRRDWYDRVGGHESVRGFVVEDLNLGRTLKRAGARLHTLLAPKLIRCRMYDGWADMWEGFTKNVYAGVEYSPLRFAAFVAGVSALFVLPPVYVVASLAWVTASGTAPAWASLGLSVAIAAAQVRIMNRMRRHLKLRPWYAWLLPVGAFLSLVIAFASVGRYYWGGSVWKGRRYGKAGVQAF